jgi:prophage regulatory protein
MLRLREVLRRTGLSRSTIYAYIAAKEFPSPIPLGPRAVGWVEDEVNAWIEERIRAARDR